MSIPAWDTIPLLALKCILEHLGDKDALLASTVCRHWRSAMLMYDGDRHRLTIHVNQFEKNGFIVPLFKKYVKCLHIVMEPELNEAAVNTFTKYILPHFLDCVNLEELMFIGPIIMTQKRISPYAVLKRSMVETLVHKHTKTLVKLGVFGCEIIEDDHSDESNENRAIDSKKQSLKSASKDMILSRANIEAMPYSNLKHVIFDLELASTDAIATLAKLDNFRLLSLNVTSTKGSRVPLIHWSAVKPLFKHGLEVAMNIIAMPCKRLHYVINNALCPRIPMVSVKFLYCKYFYIQMVTRVARLYHTTLREFSWVDAPRHSTCMDRMISIEFDEDGNEPFSRVNPFVLLAWQCPLLSKLDIHGYWFCEYDLVGVGRLRPSAVLNVSSVYDSTTFVFEQGPAMADGQMLRVLAQDMSPNREIKRQLRREPLRKVNPRPHNIYLGPSAPTAWDLMDDGLKATCTARDRADYILAQITGLEVT